MPRSLLRLFEEGAEENFDSTLYSKCFLLVRKSLKETCVLRDKYSYDTLFACPDLVGHDHLIDSF